MNPPEENPDSPPAAEPPVAPVVLEYATPRATPWQQNRGLIIPAGIGIGAMVFVYAIALATLWQIFDPADTQDDGIAVSLIVIFLALYAGGLAMLSCFFAVFNSTTNLELRMPAFLVGPAIYFTPMFLMAIFPSLVDWIFLFWMWILLFPLAFGWLLVRPTKLAERSDP